MEMEGLQLMGATPTGSLESGSPAVFVHEAPKAAATAKPDVPDTPADKAQVRRFAELVGEAVSRLNHGIRFEIDDSTHTIITKVIDRETGEVIRQIPPQQMVDMMRRVRRYIGVLLDTQA